MRVQYTLWLFVLFNGHSSLSGLSLIRWRFESTFLLLLDQVLVSLMYFLRNVSLPIYFEALCPYYWLLSESMRHAVSIMILTAVVLLVLIFYLPFPSLRKLCYVVRNRVLISFSCLYWLYYCFPCPFFVILRTSPFTWWYARPFSFGVGYLYKGNQGVGHCL